MSNVIKIILKNVILFILMGSTYYSIELLWRGYSHWSMFILSGLCGLIIGLLNEHKNCKCSIWKQISIGVVTVLSLEFVFGCVLNLWFGLGIWDYSDQPFNLLGQICLNFAFAWAGLVFVAIVLDDLLRYLLFGEEIPTYHWKIRRK